MSTLFIVFSHTKPWPGRVYRCARFDLRVASDAGQSVGLRRGPVGTYVSRKNRIRHVKCPVARRVGTPDVFFEVVDDQGCEFNAFACFSYYLVTKNTFFCQNLFCVIYKAITKSYFAY